MRTAQNRTMAVELPPGERAALAQVFHGYPYLHGCVAAAIWGGMGRVYADTPHEPSTGLIVLDFSLFAGDAAAPGAAELVRLLEPGSGSAVVPSEAWRRLLAANYTGKLTEDPREAFAAGRFDVAALRRFSEALPNEFEIVRVESDQVEAFAKVEIDLIRNFGSPAAFAEHGIGFGVIHEGRFVAGCSSFAIGGGKLEIEIDTHPGFRRLGLARRRRTYGALVHRPGS